MALIFLQNLYVKSNILSQLWRAVPTAALIRKIKFINGLIELILYFLNT